MRAIETEDKRQKDAMISPLRTRTHNSRRRRLINLLVSAAVASASASTMTSVAAAGGRTFASPEQAADALSAAWRSGRTDQLLTIFGPDGEKLVRSGDPVAERLARERLASAYADAHHLETENTRKVLIVLGKDEWPYPIPLVRQRTGWVFDVKEGAEQIVDRRVGRNELNAIGVCHAYVEAQRDYAARVHPGDGLHEYAQRVASSEGKHDGLYWQSPEGSEESPLGPFVAAAEAQGYGQPSAREEAPYQGYYYRILTHQGKNASGGVQNYLVNGHLTGGFALVAFPAKYGDSGVMTFVVNQDGIVFEKNLGLATPTIARHMTQYDPDQSWSIARP